MSAEFKSRVHTDLASGRPVVPGETFSLSKDDLKDGHNERLISEGKIIPLSEESQNSEGPNRADLEAQAKKLKVTGISDKNMTELQQAIVEAEEKQKGGDK